MSTFQIDEIVESVGQFAIIGTRPLLCDKKPMLKIGINPPKPKSDNDYFKNAQYRFKKNGEEVYGFPASGIKKAIVTACGHCSAVKSHTRGRVFVETDPASEDYVQLFTPNGEKPEPSLYNTTADKGGGKGSVPSPFARFDDWAMIFEISFFPALNTMEDILLLLQIAGRLVGLGARRIETGDNRKFGSFRLATGDETRLLLEKLGG